MFNKTENTESRKFLESQSGPEWINFSYFAMKFKIQS